MRLKLQRTQQETLVVRKPSTYKIHWWPYYRRNKDIGLKLSGEG